MTMVIHTYQTHFQSEHQGKCFEKKKFLSILFVNFQVEELKKRNKKKRNHPNEKEILRI